MIKLIFIHVNKTYTAPTFKQRPIYKKSYTYSNTSSWLIFGRKLLHSHIESLGGAAGPPYAGKCADSESSWKAGSCCAFGCGWWGWSSGWILYRTPCTRVVSHLSREQEQERPSCFMQTFHSWIVHCVLCLTCVYESVFLHVRLLVKPFATVLAGVRSCVRVDEEVSGQGGRALKDLPAHFATKTAVLDAETELIISLGLNRI